VTFATTHKTTQIKSKKMAAPKVDSELADLLANLRGEKPLPVYNGAVPSLNPVDIYRCVITEELAKITELDASLIYPALEWTSTLDKGDLILAVPRLRVKGSPAEKAASWAAAVSRSIQFPFKCTTKYNHSSRRAR
jgi:arginyl-tRNA synthetase